MTHVKKGRRGFATMNKAKQKEIARNGGQSRGGKGQITKKAPAYTKNSK